MPPPDSIGRDPRSDTEGGGPPQRDGALDTTGELPKDQDPSLTPATGTAVTAPIAPPPKRPSLSARFARGNEDTIGVGDVAPLADTPPSRSAATTPPAVTPAPASSPSAATLPADAAPSTVGASTPSEPGTPTSPRTPRFKTPGATEAAFLQTEASLSLPLAVLIALPARFEFRKSLGAGGMGEVVLAHDKVLGRDVAIKVLKTEAQDPQMRDRLLHEAQAAAQIQHPNIVGIHDVDLDHGLIVMEYLPAGSGRKLLDEKGKLPIKEVLRLARQLCAALDAAHQAGLVHRDVKPDNVLFDKDGTVKVADFGVAQSRRKTTTGGSEIVGTPAYMAPEQLRGAAADPRADIYALGLTLYELATGRRFHSPDGPSDGTLAGLAAALKSRSFASVLARCLAEDPAHRYDTIRDLDEAIESLARRRQRRKVALLVALVAIAIAVPSVLLFTQKKVIEQTSLLKIAALPFRNDTGDPKLEWLRQGFANLVTSALRRRNVPALRHQQVRDLAGATATADDAIWAAAAKQAGANEVITGSYALVGGDLVVSSMLRGEKYIVRGRSSKADTLSDELATAIAKTLVGEPTPATRSGRRPEVVRLFEMGYAALQQHEFQRAVDILNDVLRRDPDYVDAHYALITALSSIQTPEASLVTEVDKALARNLNERERALFEALRLRVLRRYDEAAARYDQLRGLYPTEKEAHYGLADSLFHLGRGDQAMAAFKNLVKIAPTFHLAYHHPTEYLGTRASPREMNAYLYYLRRAMPPPQFLAVMEMRLEQAKRSYPRALQRLKALDSPGPEALAAMASNHALIGDLEAAREAYAQASALTPENWELRIARAAIDLTQGAVADFHSDGAWEMAGTEQPTTLANRTATRGLLYALLGRRTEAKRDLDEVALTIGPETQRRLPRLLYLEGFVGMLAKDVARLQPLVARQSAPEMKNDFAARPSETKPFLRGALLAAKGQYAAAYKKLLEGYRAREDGSFAPVFLLALARVAVANGDLTSAAAHCEELLKPPAYSPMRAPALPPCWGILADIRDRQGKPEESRKNARALLLAWKDSAIEIPELLVARRLAGPAIRGTPLDGTRRSTEPDDER